MRRRKHKNVRRAVRFYKISYGFREPFKVVLDGNFVHVMREMAAGDPKERVPQLLGGNCRLFVTRCVMNELRALGPDFKPTHDDARKIELYKCGHDDNPLAPSACILDLIGAKNHEHLWVCTQDQELRGKLGAIPGAPSLFMTVNGMMLEDPSDFHEAKAKEVEDRHMRVGEHEKMAGALKDIGPEVIRTNVKFRKNRAKGPNPLAMKRKSTKQPGAEKKKQEKKVRAAAVEGVAAADGGGKAGKDKRTRKRRRGGAEPAGGGG